MVKGAANETTRYTYTCLACTVANDGRPTSRRLCARCDPGRAKLRADAKFEMRVAKRRLAALEAARDERLHTEADEARSVASESRTVTTAKASGKAKAAMGTRPISTYLTR